MTDTATELRIIARDGGKLSQSDRALIAQAAEALENALWSAGQNQMAMIEANARCMAIGEQLAAVRRKLAAAEKPAELPWQMSTGWVRTETRSL